VSVYFSSVSSEIVSLRHLQDSHVSHYFFVNFYDSLTPLRPHRSHRDSTSGRKWNESYV